MGDAVGLSLLQGASDDMQQLSWLIMHGLTWPEMLRGFCQERANQVALDDVDDSILTDLALRVERSIDSGSYW